MYPLAVALAMMCFFREKGSVWVFAAIGMSIVGAVLVSLGNVDFTRGNTTLGMVSAAVSVVSYGGYIVGVPGNRAVSATPGADLLRDGAGALYFIAGTASLQAVSASRRTARRGSASSGWRFRPRPCRT